MTFADRRDAGKQLAQALSGYRGEDVVVFGLARGGVVLAAEVARALNAPLDVLIPRKIGHPQKPEFAIGAVAENGHKILDDLDNYAIDPDWLESEIAVLRAEARRRREVYTGGRVAPQVAGKTAILVDDGIATGLTMLLSILEVRHRNPAKIVVAVPVAPRETAEQMRMEADEFVCLYIPPLFLGGIGLYYEDFSQVEDAEVIELLKEPVPA